ncbi:MAG: ABC transporter ATP-binding protein [Nitrososphaeria archaeon]
MTLEILKALELSKVYKGGVKALDNVTFEFKGQGVFTILGRNGAGKTTFLRIIGTQLLPSSGKAYVLGYDVVKESKNVRKNITVMPQEGSTLPPLTPWDHVYYTLRIRGFSKEEAKENALEALSALELLEYKDVHADQLSGGLRQRTLVAMAMATKSKLLLLDEPTLGLDPLSRRNIWKVIRDYCRKYGSIILTTHYLDEAEVLSDDIVILNNGKVIAKGSVEQLKSEVREKVKVEVYNGFTEEELKSYGRIVVVGDRKRVLTDEKSAHELVKMSIERGIKVQTSPITLDDVFVDLAAEGE